MAAPSAPAADVASPSGASMRRSGLRGRKAEVKDEEEEEEVEEEEEEEEEEDDEDNDDEADDEEEGGGSKNFRAKPLRAPSYLALPRSEDLDQLHPAITRAMVERHRHRLAATLLDQGVPEGDIQQGVWR